MESMWADMSLEASFVLWKLVFSSFAIFGLLIFCKDLLAGFIIVEDWALRSAIILVSVGNSDL